MKKFISDNIEILKKSAWNFTLIIIAIAIFTKDYKFSIDDFILGVIITLLV